MQLEYVDIGSGLAPFGVFSGLTLDQCEQECLAHQGCLAFSIKCGAGVECDSLTYYDCSLKNSLSTGTVIENSNFLSVLINPFYQNQQTPFIGWEFKGNDITGITGTYDECIQACLDTPNCGMVEVQELGSLTNSSTQNCILETITNLGWGFQDGWQSYILPQTSTGGTNLDTHCLPCPQGSQR